MKIRPLALGLLVAAASGCVGEAARPDPAVFATASSLSAALDRASLVYAVPRDVLAAIAYSETRFADPRALDVADGEHHSDDVGALHLRPSTSGGVDTLARATSLLGVSREALAANVGVGVAGAAAVLAELGRETGARSGDVGSWAEAVARFSGFGERPMQVSYARQVFELLREGANDTAYSGELVTVGAHAALPLVESLLGVNQAAQFSADYGPALWNPASSSNYTVGRGGSAIQYVVIHTMEGSYAGSISWMRNPASNVSAHYCVRSSDGEITQMVTNSNTAWHAGNWFYNQHSIGIEHEGYVAAPSRWYTEAMYRASARLVRNLCDRYHIPIDRAHIIGHYQIPPSGSGAPCATTARNCGGAGNHTDPGNGGTAWNWDHFMALVRGNGTVPPTTPSYAATLGAVSCPSEATSGDRPVAYVEYRNTGTATWDVTNTRIGTTNPRDHNGVFFDMVNWVSRSRPSGVDRATAPGATGRFSFVLGIPTVTADTTLTETYSILQEGVTWFGPGDSAVRCTVRVHPRTPPAPVDAGAPRDVVTARDVAAADAGAPRDVVTADAATNPDDVAVIEDAAAVDDASGDDVFVDESIITDDDAPPGDLDPDTDHEVTDTTADQGCNCATAGASRGVSPGAFSLLALGAVASRRRRRAAKA